MLLIVALHKRGVGYDFFKVIRERNSTLSNSNNVVPFVKPKNTYQGEPKTFSILHELQVNRFRYQGGDLVQLYHLPIYLLTCINTLRATLEKPPYVSCVIACCIEHGLEVLNSKKDIEDLKAVLKRIDLLKGVDNVLKEALYFWFSKLPITVPNLLSSNTKSKTSIRLQEPTRDLLSRTSDQTGIHPSVLGIYCITETMKNESTCLERHYCDTMKSVVNKFGSQVHGHVNFSTKLIESLSETSKANDGDW